VLVGRRVLRKLESGGPRKGTMSSDQRDVLTYPGRSGGTSQTTCGSHFDTLLSRAPMFGDSNPSGFEQLLLAKLIKIGLEQLASR
jgi:hypothetical protein